MDQDITVRVGNPDDVHDIMEIALMACEENGFVNPNPEKLLQDIWPALNMNMGIVGVVGSPSRKVEGAVLLRIGKMWYSDHDVLEEKAIFIHPEYRNAKGGRASRLVEFSKNAADQLGIPLIIGVLSNNRTEAKVRLYERHFGKPTGAFFLYNAKTGGWNAEAE